MTESAALPHHTGSAAAARDLIRRVMSRAGIHGGQCDDAVLVVSELVGNSLRHARPRSDGTLRLCWQLDHGELLLEVTDGGGTGFPHVRRPDLTATSGRGLAIIDRVARRWGARTDVDGVTVWAVLRADSQAGASRHPRAPRRREVQ